MTFCSDFDQLQIPMLFYSVCQKDVRSREVPQHRANLKKHHHNALLTLYTIINLIRTFINQGIQNICPHPLTKTGPITNFRFSLRINDFNSEAHLLVGQQKRALNILSIRSLDRADQGYSTD